MDFWAHFERPAASALRLPWTQRIHQNEEEDGKSEDTELHIVEIVALCIRICHEKPDATLASAGAPPYSAYPTPRGKHCVQARGSAAWVAIPGAHGRRVGASGKMDVHRAAIDRLPADLKHRVHVLASRHVLEVEHAAVMVQQMSEDALRAQLEWYDVRSEFACMLLATVPWYSERRSLLQLLLQALQVVYTTRGHVLGIDLLYRSRWTRRCCCFRHTLQHGAITPALHGSVAYIHSFGEKQIFFHSMTYLLIDYGRRLMLSLQMPL